MHLQQKIKKDRTTKLILALIIDAIGLASYTIPVIAEATDFFWGPLSGILIYMIFKTRPKVALAGGLGGIIEEITPGFDFIPTASVVWFWVYVVKKEQTLRKYIEKDKLDQRQS